MISLKKLLTEDKKVKIYVQKGKKPPKGKQLKKGPRGGQYFVGSPGEKQAYDTGKSKSPTKKSVNIFDKPSKKPEWQNPKFVSWAKSQGLDPAHGDNLKRWKGTEDYRQSRPDSNYANLAKKPKKDKTFNVDGNKIKKSELLQIAGNDFESFTKLSKTRYGLNFVGKLKSGKYDSRDSNLVSGFISDNDVENFVKRKKQTKKKDNYGQRIGREISAKDREEQDRNWDPTQSYDYKIETSLDNLDIENWSKESDDEYFVKGEFDKGIKIFRNPDEDKWYIATEDSEGNLDDEQELPEEDNHISDLIDDYNFKINHTRE